MKHEGRWTKDEQDKVSLRTWLKAWCGNLRRTLCLLNSERTDATGSSGLALTPASFRMIHRAKRAVRYEAIHGLERRAATNALRRDCFATAYGPMLAMTILILFLSLFQVFPVHAEDKTWNAAPDATDWFAEENWFPSPAPVALDSGTINSSGANVKIGETFNVKSLTLGGNYDSNLTIEDFVSGTVAPASTSDIAVLNRKDGHMIMKGDGTVVLKGSYKDSEEDLAPQPSLVFSIK